MADSTLVDVLKECKLPELIERFKSEKIDSYVLPTLTDGDLSKLGVCTIGDRHRVRQTLKTKIEEIRGNDTRDDSRQNDQQDRPSLARTIERERSLLFGRPSRAASSRSRANMRRSKTPKPHGWTHIFICLARKDQQTDPSTTKREILHKAGLGKKRIRLNKDDDQNAVFNKLMSDDINESGDYVGFPQLRAAGGFELMRVTQNCKDLTLLDCQWTAYNIQKNVNPQSNIYIRPIQQDLSTKALSDSSKESADVKIQCKKFKLEFPLLTLREHSAVCSASDVEIINDGGDMEETVIYVLDSTHSENTFIGQEVITSMNVPVTATDSVTETGNGENESSTYMLPDMQDVVRQNIYWCKTENIADPVEIVRKLQKDIVTGRPLDVEDETQCEEGDTNFILVDRENILSTGFEEIGAISDPRKTLEVQFYGEVAMDYRGPRKEFFRIIMLQIKEKYFDNGLRDLLFEDYEMVGRVFALSILQNGKMPQFLASDIMDLLFGNKEELSPCIKKLREGLDWLGLYEAVTSLPPLMFIFHRSSVNLTFKMLTTFLKPEFSETGSNQRKYEQTLYAAFMRYLRVVAGGRRPGVSLHSVLQFSTEAEPLLGFKIHPAIEFTETIISTNSCINKLTLPRPSHSAPLPEDTVLFP